MNIIITVVDGLVKIHPDRYDPRKNKGNSDLPSWLKKFQEEVKKQETVQKKRKLIR